jgi:hypothetical protein
MDNFEGLSSHGLNILLNALRAATPSVLDAEDPVRVALLKRIEKVQKQEYKKISGNESEER